MPIIGDMTWYEKKSGGRKKKRNKKETWTDNERERDNNKQNEWGEDEIYSNTCVEIYILTNIHTIQTQTLTRQSRIHMHVCLYLYIYRHGGTFLQVKLREYTCDTKCSASAGQAVENLKTQYLRYLKTAKLIRRRPAQIYIQSINKIQTRRATNALKKFNYSSECIVA